MTTAASVPAGVDSVLQWFDGMNEGDAPKACSRFAPDARWFGVDKEYKRRYYHGPDEIASYLGAFLNNAVVDLKYTLRHVARTGQTVLVEWDDTATQVDGGTYHNFGVLVFDLAEDGRVNEVRSYFDFQPMFDIERRWRTGLPTR